MNEERKQIIISYITHFIKSETRSRDSEGVVLGMSGGVDSSVAAWLAVKALGPKRVLGLILPDSSVTPKKDTKDAEELAKKLRIRYKVIEVGNIKNQFLRILPKHKLARANFLVRLRMSILYYYAAAMNRLVLGTGNKSELKLGYFTKYGDAAIDLMPLGDLFKTEVRELADFMQIPMEISRKKSSARLWRGQTTEREIGLPYEEIDSILMQLEDRKEGKRKGLPDHYNEGNTAVNVDAAAVNKKIKPVHNKAEVKHILEIIKKNGHKLDPPPICRIR